MGGSVQSVWEEGGGKRLQKDKLHQPRKHSKPEQLLKMNVKKNYINIKISLTTSKVGNIWKQIGRITRTNKHKRKKNKKI